MTNNGHNNSCDFSETLVSYLYGEIGAAESEKFKAHLAACAVCAEELAGFGAMRSSLAEWRLEEFAPLSAAAIELGARTSRPPEREAFGSSSSWLDAVRAFFTPKIALTAAGFAALVICAGLVFAFLISPNAKKQDLVATNSQPEKKIENVDIKTPPAINIRENGTKDNVAKNEAAGKERETSVIKTSGKTARPATERAGYQPKNNVAVNGNKHQDAPRIKPGSKTLNTDIYEEAEDDSLRLADLFAEADTE